MPERISLAQWQDAYALWLGSRRSDATRRSYRETFDELLSYLGKPINSIIRSDIYRYVAMLAGKKLADKTVNLKLYAISSFYGYIKQLYTALDESGNEVPAITSNPTLGIQKHKNNIREEIYYLNAGESKELLSVIDKSTKIGSRDYALLVSYLILGRRNSEIRNLKWGDFHAKDGRMKYVWSGKGQVNQKAECPPTVWNFITEYLRINGRLYSIGKDDYIFTATNQKYGNHPITMQEVGRIVKKYARLTDLDVKKIHPNSLRHSATMLRVLNGQSISEISSYLGHTNIGTTQNYVHQLQGVMDEQGEKVAGLIGL